jgi:hypothetical protein
VSRFPVSREIVSKIKKRSRCCCAAAKWLLEFSVIAYAAGVMVGLPAADEEKKSEEEHEPVKIANQPGVFRHRAR